MNINPYSISQYVCNFLNTVFDDKIHIDVLINHYVINNVKKIPIYSFWNKKDNELLADFNGNSFNNDYIGTIFFFLSGYWEYTHDNIKDEYGRFPAKESFNYKKRILDKTIVDILVKRIAEELTLDYNSFFSSPKIFITHDIDSLGMFDNNRHLIRSICGDLIKRRDMKLALDKIGLKLRNSDPHSVYNLIDIHKEYNTKGTFFFMPGIQPKEMRGGYNLKSEAARLKSIKDSIMMLNGSIGLHYDSRYLKRNQLDKDKRILGKLFDEEIRCGRAHYLLFDIKKSFGLYEKANIEIDTTGSFADIAGFRFGTSYPFRPYNFLKDREYNLIEIPLIVMEGTLTEKYMNLSPQEGFSYVTRLMDIIKKYNGVFTLLWHNTSFYTPEWRKWEWVYEATLEYGIDNSFVFVNIDDFVDRRITIE